jgi:hypothetical protein
VFLSIDKLHAICVGIGERKGKARMVLGFDSNHFSSLSIFIPIVTNLILMVLLSLVLYRGMA